MAPKSRARPRSKFPPQPAVEDRPLINGDQAAALMRLFKVFANNAGVVIDEAVPLADYTEDAFDKTIAVNLKGVWLGMKYQIPAMLAGGGGAIVNHASVMGTVAGCCCAYVASKHGVIGLTKAGALQYASQGIRVNAVCPGGIQTPMMDSLPSEDREQITAMHPIGRLATPEEIAEAVVWLCSDRASYLCGSVVTVDGGYTIQ